MSNKKAKAERKAGRNRGSEADLPGLRTGWSPRLRAIGLRALFFAVFVAVSGFGISVYWKYAHPPKALHTFSAKERSAFIAMLKSSGVPTKSVWLACPDGKAETCRLVKQFVSMFQESGWKVEDDKVIQWKPAHPLGGVYLILRKSGEPGDTAPRDAVGVRNSFLTIGIPVQTASAPDVPKNSIGVFFGPDL